VENAIFSWQEIARWFWTTGVFLGGKSHDHRRLLVAFEKEVSLKSFISLSLFSKTIFRRYCSLEKVQKNTGSRRNLQVTKAAFKGPHRFVFFTAESLLCSETQPSK